MIARLRKEIHRLSRGAVRLLDTDQYIRAAAWQHFQTGDVCLKGVESYLECMQGADDRASPGKLDR